MKRCFLGTAMLCLCLCVQIPVWAQLTLSGKVLDDQSAEPLTGATVKISGTATGVATDANGAFTLELPSGQPILEISYVGYQTVKVQADPNRTSIVVRLTSDYLNLNEVSVVGYDTRNTLLKTPGTLGLVTQRDMLRADKTSMSQLLAHVPGVHARGGTVLRPSTISIRGMGSRSPGASGRVKIYLNDLMLTNPDGSNAWEDIDPYTIGRMEVLKGPASSIYGASVGGVINITTENAPYGQQSVEAFGLVGSFGTYRYGSTVRVGTEKTNIMATYGTQMTDGYRDFSQEDRNFLTFLGTFQPSSKQTLTVFINRNRYASRAPGALTPAQAEENPRQALAVSELFNAGRDIRFTRIGVSSEYQIAPRLTNTTSVTASFSDLDHPIQGIYIFNWIQNYGGRTRFQYTTQLGGISTRLILGAESQLGVNRLNFYGNANGRPNGTVVGDRVSNAQNTVVFSQAEFDLTERILFTLGYSANFYRYSYTEFTRNGAPERIRDFDPFFAPRAAINYRYANGQAIHANVSRGFTPPAVGDINQPDGTVNETLGPETAWSYEVGTRGSLFGNRFQYDVAAFRMLLNGEILLRTPQVGFSTRENAGRTAYNGLETYLSYTLLQAAAKPLSLLRVYASYTLLNATFEDFVENPAPNVEISANGKLVPGNAPHRLFAGLEAESAWGVYAHLTYEYTDAVPIDNLNERYADAFGLLGAKIGFRRTIGQHFALDAYAGGNNLTDETYTDAPALNPRAYASGPLQGQFPFMNVNWGRNYYGGLSLKYLF